MEICATHRISHAQASLSVHTVGVTIILLSGVVEAKFTARRYEIPNLEKICETVT